MRASIIYSDSTIKYNPAMCVHECHQRKQRKQYAQAAYFYFRSGQRTKIVALKRE